MKYLIRSVALTAWMLSQGIPGYAQSSAGVSTIKPPVLFKLEGISAIGLEAEEWDTNGVRTTRSSLDTLEVSFNRYLIFQPHQFADRREEYGDSIFILAGQDYTIETWRHADYGVAFAAVDSLNKRLTYIRFSEQYVEDNLGGESRRKSIELYGEFEFVDQEDSILITLQGEDFKLNADSIKVSYTYHRYDNLERTKYWSEFKSQSIEFSEEGSLIFSMSKMETASINSDPPKSFSARSTSRGLEIKSDSRPTVCDILGRPLVTNRVSLEEYLVPRSLLRPGVYFVAAAAECRSMWVR